MNMRMTGLMIGLALVLLAMAGSIVYGKAPIRLSVVVDAVLAFDGSREHLLIRTVRLPRALIAMSVGVCLGMAGAIMQGITRNPLAGPELFGVNQGAALLVVIHILILGSASPAVQLGTALLGAGVAAASVYTLGSLGSRGLTPVKLVLAGSVINLFLVSLTQGILVFDEQSLDTMRFWLAGSLTGRSLELFRQAMPLMLAGLVIALMISRQVNLISLGEETAQGLGQRLQLMRTASLLAVMLLAGSSVAVAGPIGFIGLAVPHLARAVSGADYRWTIPYSAVIGALLLLLADIAARFILPTQEIPAGIVTAMFGAPFLIYLAQRRT